VWTTGNSGKRRRWRDKKLRVKRLKPAFIVIGTLIALGIAAALFGKQILITFHRREIERMKQESSPLDDSLFLRSTNRWLRWPGDAFFVRESKGSYHVQELVKLGYLTKATFRVSAWALKGAFVWEGAESPLNRPGATPEADAYRIGDEDLDLLRRNHGYPPAPPDAEGCPTYGELTVYDRQDRMALWKAFIDEFNAQDWRISAELDSERQRNGLR
jgi:hypothetical protein